MLTQESIQKLRAVAEAILAQPRFYNQSRYPDSYDCGTTCCLAGWAIWLNDEAEYARLLAENDDTFAVDWVQAACDALGLERTDRIDWQLFVYASTWPKKFRDAFDEAATPKARAKVAAARIEHFIATDGKE